MHGVGLSNTFCRRLYNHHCMVMVMTKVMFTASASTLRRTRIFDIATSQWSIYEDVGLNVTRQNVVPCAVGMKAICACGGFGLAYADLYDGEDVVCG